MTIRVHPNVKLVCPLTGAFLYSVICISFMPRNRSERRALTKAHSNRRKRQVSNGLRCSNTVSANGESCSCALCISSKNHTINKLPTASTLRDREYEMVSLSELDYFCNEFPELTEDEVYDILEAFALDN